MQNNQNKKKICRFYKYVVWAGIDGLGQYSKYANQFWGQSSKKLSRQRSKIIFQLHNKTIRSGVSRDSTRFLVKGNLN